MKYKSILFCTADPTKNAGNIRDYFIESSESFIAFHFFPGYSSESTYMEKYQDGKILLRRNFTLYKGKNKFIKNTLDYVYFSYTLLFYTDRKSYVIVNAPFFCSFYFIFQLFKSFRYVLWIGDYYPQKSFPMNIYHTVVDFYNTHLKYVIYLSPPLEKIYSKQPTVKNGYRAVIPLGIKKEYKRKKRKIAGKIRVGFIGIIREQQGLDLFFQYLVHSDDCILEVVGDGYLLTHYKSMAKSLGITKKVKFYGKVENIKPIFKNWDVGIALYENIPSNLSKYCEPTKIKHYLSFGLPVITTKTTYFHKELEELHAGIVIDENVGSLQKAILSVKSDYDKYLIGVDKLTEKYQHKDWYDRNLSFLEK